MREIKRILLASDLRENTQNLWNAGAYLAHKLGCDMVLFHAVPEIQGAPFNPADLQAEAVRLMEETRLEILKKNSFRVEVAVSLGAPVKKIIEAADQYDADAIMVGSGTKEPGEKYQLGVTAEQIMRYSRRPVWVIKSGVPLQIDAILCPVDFSNHSSLALEYAVSLARAFTARLAVVNVVEDLSNIYPGRPLLEPHEIGSYRDEQQTEFDKFLTSFDFSGIHVETLLLQGKPHEEILELVRDKGCHLIIMGSEGRTGLTRLIMGSVAEKVMREVPCSVLTVKSKV